MGLNDTYPDWRERNMQECWAEFCEKAFCEYLDNFIHSYDV